MEDQQQLAVAGAQGVELHELRTQPWQLLRPLSPLDPFEHPGGVTPEGYFAATLRNMDRQQAAMAEQVLVPAGSRPLTVC
jgi:hypothetical protein